MHIETSHMKYLKEATTPDRDVVEALAPNRLQLLTNMARRSKKDLDVRATIGAVELVIEAEQKFTDIEFFAADGAFHDHAVARTG